jgi:L-fucose isomerase-like protein
MAINFRKVKIGFVNLALDFLEEEDLKMASKYADDAKNFLTDKMDVSIDEFSKPVSNIVQAREVWKQFKSSDVDAVIIFNGTFSTGESTVELVRNLNVPFLVWGIEEFAIAKHNFTGSMVGTLPQGTIFKNLNRNFSFAYGNIAKETTKNKIQKFIKAVRAISYLKEATIGVLGMRPDGFEISDFDELAVKNKFGTTITKVSMYGFSNIIKSITDEEIGRDMEIQKKIFDITEDQMIPSRGLSRVYLAMKKVIKEKNLQSYAPDCWPELRDIDQTPICPANGRFNTEGIMASCECDVDGSLS